VSEMTTTRVPTLWDLVDRLWDDAAGRPPVMWAEGRAVPTIRVEEHVEDDHLVVRAELPGIDPDRDVDVSLADDRLTITAQRLERTSSSERGRRRSEFRYGTFMRSLVVPPGTDATQVRADYADGILTITAPLPAAPREPLRIAVGRPSPTTVTAPATAVEPSSPSTAADTDPAPEEAAPAAGAA